MSSLIEKAISIIPGFLLNKFRDFTANELKQGDVADEKCRKLIVRELHDIKTNLDAQAQKELLSSVSFFEEGYSVLSLARSPSTDGVTSFTQLHKEDILEAAERSHMTAAGCSSLSQAISKISITSDERFTAAKKSFEKSNTDATRAFNNTALSTEDRIMATKVRVVSRILESLEDPEAAVVNCKLYLEGLHRIPAVQAIFSIQLSGGVKSYFSKAKRLECMMTITMINFAVFDFALKSTNSSMRDLFLNWPKIELAKRTYNPLIPECEIFRKLYESGVRLPRQVSLKTKPRIIHDKTQVNSKGELIGVVYETEKGNVYKFTAGETQLFYKFPQEDRKAKDFAILSLAIDEDDNVYIVTRNESVKFPKLLVLDAEGNRRHQSVLEAPLSESFCYHYFTISKDIIVIPNDLRDDNRAYVCDRLGRLKYEYRFRLPSAINYHHDGSLADHMTSSDENEIIIGFQYGDVVYIFTEEGKLKQKFKIQESEVNGIVFNHATKEIIVHAEKIALFDGLLNSYSVSSYSMTGEHRRTLPIDTCWLKLFSHPSGLVAILIWDYYWDYSDYRKNDVVFIQSLI